MGYALNWFARSLKLVGRDASYGEHSQMMVWEDFREFAGEIPQKHAGIVAAIFAAAIFEIYVIVASMQ